MNEQNIFPMVCPPHGHTLHSLRSPDLSKLTKVALSNSDSTDLHRHEVKLIQVKKYIYIFEPSVDW